MMKQVIFVAMLVVLATFVNSQGDPTAENIGLENCKCAGTFEYLPLCANNGVTYSNPSMFNCAKKCLGKSDLTKVRDGRC